MPSSEPPGSDHETNVTSLVDRLPPARRAKLLARIAIEPHVSGRDQIAQFGELAAHIEGLDLDVRIAELEAAPPNFAGVREARIGCRAIRAMRSFLRNDPDGALAEWAEIIAEDPEWAAPAHFYRSQVHVVRGDLGEALSDVNRALVLSPQDAHAYARRGEIYHLLKRDAEAVPNFLRAAQLDPDCLAALSGMGVCRFLEGDWVDAIRWYTRAIRSAPKRSRLYLARALCFENERRLSEALADFDASIALDQDDAAAFHGRGRCHNAASHAQAIADFTRSIDIDDSEASVWSDRGRASFLAGALDAAERDATRAIELDPTEARAYFTRALVYHRGGDIARSALDYEAAARIEPTEMIYVTACAKVHARLGDAAAIRADLDATIAIKPTAVEFRMLRARLLPLDPVIRFQRALYYEQVERWDESIADHTRTIELAPNAGVFHFRRGVARWQASDDAAEMRAALADYDRAIELDGDEPEVLRWRADAHTHFGDHRAALEDLDRALALDPDSGEALYLRYACKGELGDEADAQEDLLRARELGWPEALEELASES